MYVFEKYELHLRLHLVYNQHMAQQNTATSGVLSHTKRRIGEIYIEALSVSQNFTCIPYNGGEGDNLGIDYQLYNCPQGVKKDIYIEEAKQILLQVKGTSVSSQSMFEQKDDHYLYTLSKSVFKVAGIKTYVVVVCVPDEETFKEWIHIDSDKILLYAKAYFYEVQTGGIAKGKQIKIPKQNILDKIRFNQMFE